MVTAGSMSTGKLRFLTLVKPVLHVLPEVAAPDRKIPFKVRTHGSILCCGPRLSRVVSLLLAQSTTKTLRLR